MSFTYEQLKTAIQDFAENTETSFVTNIPVFIRACEDRIFSVTDLELFRKNATATLSQDDPYLSVPSDYLASFSLQITTANKKDFLLQKDVNFVQEYSNDTGASGTPKYYAVFDVDNFILSPTPDSALTTELHYYYRPASIVDTTIGLSLGTVTGTFSAGEYVQGTTSNTVGQISSITGGNILNITPKTISGTGFLAANVGSGSSYGVTEVVSGLTSGASAITSQVIAGRTWLSENAPNALLYGSLVEAYTYMKGEQDMMQLYEQRFVQEIQRLKDLAEARENTDAYRQGLPSRPRT